MTITGKIKNIGNILTLGKKDFKKRDLVIETETEFPQILLIEFIGNKCKLLDSYKAGESVCVSISIKGREWSNPEGRVVYFNSIQGWKVRKI